MTQLSAGPSAMYMPRVAPGSLVVIQVVNSTFGRPGQIAFRAGFIKRRMDERAIANVCLTRDRGTGGHNVVQVLPFGDVLPRLLNAYRLFVNPRFNHRGYDVRLFEAFASPWLRRRLSTAAGPTVVHLWEFSPSLIRVARAAGARIVLEVPIAPSHETVRLQEAGFTMDTPVSGIDPNEDAALRTVDMLMSPSTYVTNILRRIGLDESRIFTNPYGVTIPTFEKEYPDRPRGLTYVLTGTLSKRKGVDYLLQAWVEGGFDQDRLILCGRTARSIAEVLRALPVRNVKRVGYVDVMEYLRTADVFVLPTLMEGSSKTVFEAMAAGLPVITTTHAGSVVENGVDGFLVPIGDTFALIKAMRTFKDHPALVRQMGTRGRAKMREYTWDRYADRAIALYQDVAGR